MKRKLESEELLTSEPMEKKSAHGKEPVVDSKWNIMIQQDQCPRREVSQAWAAAHASCTYNHTRLNELLSEPEHLKYLDWNLNPRDTGYCSYGISLAWLAVQLTENGDPRLLVELLKLPEILVTVNWDATPQFQDHPQKDKSVIIKIFNLITESKTDINPFALKNWLHEDILLTLSWNHDALKDAFYRMFNKNKSSQKNFLECDIALAELSYATLQKFIVYFEPSRYKDLAEYLKFLIALKSPTPTSDFISNFDDKIFILRSGTAHLVIARSKTAFLDRLYHFMAVSGSHPLFFEAQYELASLHLMGMDEEQKIELSPHREQRLIKAFEYACQWVHADKEEKQSAKLAFINRIVTEMLSPWQAEKRVLLSEPPNITGQTDITTTDLTEVLVEKLTACQPVEVGHLTQDLLNQIKIFKLKEQIAKFSNKIQLLESIKTGTSSSSHSTSSLNFFGS
jgi:hypothetical protein